MKQTTCNIIKLCKDYEHNSLEKIAEYMAKECYCPIEVYTSSVIEKIMFDAMCDYIDSCDKPSDFLNCMADIKSRCKNTSNAKLIAATFIQVQVLDMNTTRYVNGFTQEMLDKARSL